MPRVNRVLSFMTQWGIPPRSPTATAPASPTTTGQVVQDTFTPSASTTRLDEGAQASPTPPRTGRERSSSRPASMIYTYQPPMMAVAQDTLPELMPIFTYLNAHSNRLYQEGYFLKLHDLDSRGRPSAERNWVECFAQLVGTVLSIWDAAALDAVGADAEVVPTFVNLTDASIKMIESLPMNGQPGQSLPNVLSISTAANNRYLLHFNSLHSLTQWTAGIRLAMFEHASLQEAYTGSLIAGKGKQLNNIRQIMDRARFPTEDWARVRFGAGIPWRRCWCVISPPGEKEIKNAQKALKKRSTYDKTRPTPTGDIKFYETRKITKKTKPIASITNAYAAYAIYPQSKPLIDQSTLVKVEGQITIQSDPPSTTEGFVFVMPEVHPAVTGFEILLRWLFPVFDTFALYGRPDRLIPDVLDTRSLMFALPKDKRYGYLEILDVAGLLHTAGSQNWTEREWRQQMKDLTSKRISSRPQTPSREDGRASPRRNTTSRTSLPRGGTLRFDETPSLRSASSTRLASPPPPPREEMLIPPRRTDSAPPTAGPFSTPHHQRAVSETNGYKRYQTETPSRLSHEAARRDDYENPPLPPQHGGMLNGHYTQEWNSSYTTDVNLGSSGRGTPDGETPPRFNRVVEDVHHDAPLAPVAAPPAFVHKPNQKPPTQPMQAPDLRRANSALDAATLSQLADATHQSSIAAAGAAAAWNKSPDTNRSGAQPSATGGNSLEGIRPAPAMGFSSQSPPDDHSAFHQGMKSRFGQPPNNRRLPTIPASPFVDQSASSPESPFFKSFVPQLSATNESGLPESTQVEQSGQTYLNYDQMHENPSLTDNQPAAIAAHRPDAKARLSSHSITRKPVPSHTQDTSSRGKPHHETMEPLPSHSSNGHSASVDSPDYASTESAQSKKSVEKPRPGVLRTIGNAELLVEGKPPPDSDVPIDFGPTFSYDPTTSSRTGTSTPLTQNLDDKIQSNTHRGTSGRTTPNFERPPAERRSSYGLAGEPSPAYGSGPDTGSKTPGSGPTTPGYDVVERDGRQTVAWSPGMTVNSGPQSRQTLAPEQWVQQRAATAAQVRTPVYAHHRQGSSGTPVYAHQRHGSGGTPPLSSNASGDWSQAPQSRTPPLVRNPSGDWLQLQQARTSPREIAYRQRPQDSSVNVSGVNFSQRLSAREQEHVARVTGSPLIQMAGSGHKQRQPSGGLIGAIEAREREKQEIRDGNRNAAVQQAILLRHQQQLQHQQESVSQAHAQQLARPPPAQQMMGPNQVPSYSQTYGPMQGSFVMPQQAPQAAYIAQHMQQPFQSPQMMQQQSQMWQQQVFAQGGEWPSLMGPNVHQAPTTAGAYQQQPTVQQQPYGMYFVNAQAAPQGQYGQQTPYGQQGYQR